MRVKTAAGLMAVAGALVFASPAMAWTYQDCVKDGFNHPDCEKYEKPPVKPPEEKPPEVVIPPNEAPPVVVPPVVTPPEAGPPVAPPVAPPVTPEAPKVEKPKKPKYDHPTAPRKKQTGEQGKTEQRGRNNTPVAPQAQTVSSTANGELPYTGLPAGIVALAGAGLAAAGFRLRRR